jgi:hypothetical protein
MHMYQDLTPIVLKLWWAFYPQHFALKYYILPLQQNTKFYNCIKQEIKIVA